MVDADQLELAERRQIRSIALMEITTFTDRGAETVDSTFYFSTLGVRFDLDDTTGAHDFLPFINSIGHLKQEMPHLSGPDDGPQILSRPLSINMRNGLVDGTAVYLFNALNADNIVNARVRIFELLLPDTSGAQPTVGVLDDLSGKQTPFYSGVIRQLINITADDFTIECKTELPELDYDIVNTLDSDNRIVGVIANDVYGVVDRIPCHGFDIGQAQPLVVEINSVSTTSINLASVEKFPDSGEVMVGRERITYTGRNEDSHTLTGLTRAVGGTLNVGHSAAELCVSILTTGAKYLVARHAMDSVSDVLVRSPLDGRLLLLNPLTDYDVKLSTTSGIPDGMTGPVCYIHFTNVQIRAMIAKFYGQAEYEEESDTDVFTDSVADDEFAVDNTGSDTYPTDVDGPDDMDDSDAILSGGEWQIVQNLLENQGVAFQWSGLSDLPFGIEEWRIRITLSEIFVATAGTDLRFQVYMENGAPLGAPSGQPLVINSGLYTGPNTYFDQELTSEWYEAPATPPRDPTPLNLVDFNKTSTAPNWGNIFVVAFVDNDRLREGNYVKFLEGSLILETRHVDPGAADPRVTDANSATRFQGGTGLEVYAVGGGYVVPGGATEYNVPAGTLIQAASDMARHLIVERAGLSHDNIDDTTWGDDETENGLAFVSRLLSPAQFPDYSATEGGGPSTYHFKNGNPVETDNTATLVSGTQAQFVSNTGNNQCCVFYNSSSASNDLLVRRWRIRIIGDYTGGSGASETSGLNYEIHNIPAGGGGFAAYQNPEGTGRENLEEVDGTGSSTTVSDHEFSDGWWTPTSLVTIDDFDWINNTDWDGVHVVMTTRQRSYAQTIVIKEVYIEFETLTRGFVQSDMGFLLDVVLGRLGFEARSQIVMGEGADGPLFRWLIAERVSAGVYQFTVNGDPITEWAPGTVEHTRELENIYSRYRVFDLPDRSLINTGALREELYRNVFQLDPNVTDFSDFTTVNMAAVEAKTGNVENFGMFFVSTIFGVTESVASYYIAESIRYPAAEVKLINVPWTQAYDRQLGDAFLLQLSYWAAAKKVRVVAIEKHWQSGSINIGCVEVL